MRADKLDTFVDDVLNNLPSAPAKGIKQRVLAALVHLWLRVDLSSSEGAPHGQDWWPLDRSLCEAISALFPRQLSPITDFTTLDFSDSELCIYYAIEYAEKALVPGTPPTARVLQLTEHFKIFAPLRRSWPKKTTTALFDSLSHIEVNWTDDLQLHLLLYTDKDEPKDRDCLNLFRHATFLSRSQRVKDILPAQLVHDTLKTLALLLPAGSDGGKTTRWFTC
jgi:hypothetical protein